MRYLFIFLASTAMAITATKLVILYAKHRLLDYPNQRSSHVIPTPRGGGLGIVVAILLTIIIFDHTFEYKGYMSLILISTLGWLDDHKSIKIKYRLIVQLVVLILIINWIGLPSYLNIFHFHLYLPIYILYSLFILGGIWIINLTNFMDGIDGIAACQVSIFCIAAMIGLSVVKEQSQSALTLGMATVGACTGFLFWNWSPAKIFMGDVGSTTIGLIVVVLILFELKYGIEVELVFTPYLPFILDATWTLFRRIYLKQEIQKGHKTHIYQILSQKWNSHQLVTLLYSAISILGLCLIFLVQIENINWQIPFICISSIYIFIILFRELCL